MTACQVRNWRSTQTSCGTNTRSRRYHSTRKTACATCTCNRVRTSVLLRPSAVWGCDYAFISSQSFFQASKDT
eukprot:5096703-Amphidinium_carterae.2